MSRLADRILSSCRPVKLEDIVADRLSNESLLTIINDKYPNATDREKEIILRKFRTNYAVNQARATELFNYDTEFEGAPIIAADDVGLYFSTLPAGTDVVDIVSSMAPPFDKFFIEFQKVPNIENLYAWGVLFHAFKVNEDWPPEEILKYTDENGDAPRWMLQAATFIERYKGEPVGPIAFHLAGLADDGTWFRRSNGSVIWDGMIPKLTSEPPDDARVVWIHIAGSLNLPALLTISFMHCKNTNLLEMKPSEKLSRKAKKRTGRELIHYHTLEIDPIRKILDKQKMGSREDLRRALHICRGHFKTFTEDAPLFGQHTGKYWWAPHIKGTESVGVSIKDYRVLSPLDLGKPYKIANEDPPGKDSEAPVTKNPDSAGRGLAAHNKTQNLIAETVLNLGWQPRSPARDEPEFDLAWKVGDSLFVCEVKSVTKANEENQLRMALGQVIRYKQKLAARGHEPVFGVIAAEREPEDKSWDEVMQREGIIFIWPDNHEEVLCHIGKLVMHTNGNT